MLFLPFDGDFHRNKFWLVNAIDIKTIVYQAFRKKVMYCTKAQNKVRSDWFLSGLPVTSVLKGFNLAQSGILALIAMSIL